MIMEEVSATEPSNKKFTVRPRVIASEPDRSLNRYMTDEFKSKAINSKEVPFEYIDLKLYKPRAKLVGFHTSEERLKFWVEVIIARYIDNLSKQGLQITWEETESFTDPYKPDKIQVIVERDGKKLFVLSIFITTGRIQVQGSAYIKWSNTEFPLLLNGVNKLSNGEDIFNIDREIFNQQEVNKDEQDDLERHAKENESTDDSDSKSEDESDDESEDESETESLEDARTPEMHEKINCLEKTAAVIERDFISSKAYLETEIVNLQSSFRDEFENKPVRLENLFKAMFASLEDRIIQNETSVNNDKKTIDEMSIQIKKLQDQKAQMVTKQAKLKDEIDSLRNENSDLRKEIFLLREIVQKHENAIESELETEQQSPRETQMPPIANTSSNIVETSQSTSNNVENW